MLGNQHFSWFSAERDSNVHRPELRKLTNIVSGWKMFIFVAGVTLLPVQQKIVDQLLLVFSEMTKKVKTMQHAFIRKVRSYDFIQAVLCTIPQNVVYV